MSNGIEEEMPVMPKPPDICVYCGTEVSSTASFCGNCGKSNPNAIDEKIDESVGTVDTENNQDIKNRDGKQTKKSKKKRAGISAVIISILIVSILLFANIDGDGLMGISELKYGTNIFKSDTDGDGLNDKYEIDNDIDPLLLDTDNDGLDDYTEEMIYHSRPQYWDTDLDDLGDAEEISMGTNISLSDTDGDGYGDGCDPLPLDSTKPVLTFVNMDVTRTAKTYNYIAQLNYSISPPLLTPTQPTRSGTRATTPNATMSITSISIGSFYLSSYDTDFVKSSSISNDMRVVSIKFSLVDIIDDQVDTYSNGTFKVTAVSLGVTLTETASIPSKDDIATINTGSTITYFDYSVISETNYVEDNKRDEFYDLMLTVPISFYAFATQVNLKDTEIDTYIAKNAGSIDNNDSYFIAKLKAMYINFQLYRYSDATPQVIHSTGNAIVVWHINVELSIESTRVGGFSTFSPGDFSDLPDFYPDAIPTDFCLIVRGEDTVVRVKVGEVDYEICDYYSVFTKGRIVEELNPDETWGYSYSFGGLPISQSTIEDALLGDFFSLVETAMDATTRGKILQDIPGFMDRVMYD